ncbi:recombinase family protein [Bacillus paranthracis]|uniref:recombinase family protein n=1 Tax=Bacillus paranthracis TaxID=2026186 RepID=UPI0018AD3110|nr:recombinase family protein [Bacillus paranthracis]QPI80802.1 recombinase family protein [Bacillus paranthracis]
MSQKEMNIEERLLNAKKIGIYQRVSKEHQEHTRQNEIILQYLKSVENVETQDFKDTMSATKKSFSKRPKLKELLQEVKEENIDAIVVSDYDRLSRQPKEHDALRKLFQRLNIPVVIASKNQLYTTDDIIRNIIEVGLSKLETDNMSTRIRHSLKEKMKNGRWRGGVVPYGFIVEGLGDEKILVPVETEMKIVQKIFDWYSTSGTFNSVAKKLNKVYGGYESKHKEKKKWTANKVKYIVTNPIYMGVYAYHRFNPAGGYAFKERKEWKEVEETSIIMNSPIPKEQWERCWHKYNKLKSSAPKFVNTSFYFKGILRCMCSICNGAYFRTKDQRSKGRGDRWYISQCKRKVRATKVDEKFDKYWEWLCDKSDRLFQEEMKQLLLKELDTMQVAKNDKDIMYNQKLELLKKLKLELQKINKDMDIGEKEFIECENDLWIALIVTQQQIEEQISQLKGEIKRLTFTIEKLENIMNEENGKTFDSTLLSKKFEDHADKRSIVLMVVKECKYVIDENDTAKFEFVFNLPFNNYLQM